MKQKKQILFCILNWGLGHATRSIVLIDQLLTQSFDVSIASDGLAAKYLKYKYPNLKHYELPSYKIIYTFENIAINMALQSPKVLNAIMNERKKIKQLYKNTPFDFIISDNRYGCYHPDSINVFIGHQLSPISPWPLSEKLTQPIFNYLHNKFHQIWVPDFQSPPNLSGVLSHKNYPFDVKYIGPLSRLKFFPAKKKYDILAILSGPEPQRTILQEKLIEQLLLTNLKSCMFLGKLDTPFQKYQIKNLKIQSFGNTTQIQNSINQSSIIIARSGYSTVMDLVATQVKKAILIPTPGQTEQEYLAIKLNKQKVFLTQSQSKINISQAIKSLTSFQGINLFYPENYTFNISQLLNSISISK